MQSIQSSFEQMFTGNFGKLKIDKIEKVFFVDVNRRVSKHWGMDEDRKTLQI
jgi:hypothetical protein